MNFLSGFQAAAALLACFMAQASFAAEKGRPLPVVSPILDDAAAPAEDIIGIACLDELGPYPVCMIINDEDRKGQIVRIASNGISPAAAIKLISGDTQGAAVGLPPETNNCADPKVSFKDLDGEAVAADQSAKAFYVAGSHGCLRKKGKFRVSSFLLFKVSMKAPGEASRIEATYRLSDVLNRGALAPYFARVLSEKNGDSDASGLNVEGLAVHGSRIYVGLRAPLIGGKAVIAVANADKLFKEGQGRLIGAILDPLYVTLGQHAGIGDLAALPDGRLLILSGPTLNQSVPSEVFLYDPAKPESAPTRIIGLEASPNKPEALLYLGQDRERVRFLIMSDGAPNGAPMEYSVPLAPDGVAK